MRFNDLIATALSGRTEGARSRAILWRQCVDLFCQFDGAGERSEELDRIAATLEALRGKVVTEQKLAGLAELGNRLTSRRLLRLLLGEESSVQVVAMQNARLPDALWPSLIAEAGPLARSILRRRDDLGPEARRALDAFGLTDLALVDLSPAEIASPAPVAAVPQAPGDEGSQIRRIVDRIERFTSERQDRAVRSPHPAPASEPAPTIDQFSFAADADGVICSVLGAPRAMLAGFRFASPSLDRSLGPDGQILGAFRRRGAFREGRLTIGEGILAGCWLVDGDPLFDHRTGRFTGYRALARRAPDHVIAPFMAPPEQTITSTSLRQLIHELRTPLSGVMGFAELIESQLLGPVSDRYRSMAGDIVTDVRRLVDILDDLDIANRADRQSATVPPLGTDIATLLADAIARIGPDGDGRARLHLDSGVDLPRVHVEPTIADRMIVHLVRALAGCVGTETLIARCTGQGDALIVAIDRPQAMAGLTEAQLFDSGFEHVAVNMDAPVLGVGFALRLVRRLAQANRGSFGVHPDHFLLTLPAPRSAREQGLTS